jgi:hypothetical protein
VRNAITWAGRILAGVGLGWIWTSIVSLVWVGLASLPDGDIIAGLDRLKTASWVYMAFAAYFTSVIGCGVGAFLGTLIAGHLSAIHRPFLKGSALGACVATWLGASFGSFAAWVTGPRSPEEVVWVWAMIGVVAGIIGGWVAWQVLSKKKRVESNPTAD